MEPQADRAQTPNTVFHQRIILWAALITSVGLYYVVTQFVPPGTAVLELPENILLAASAAIVGASVLARNFFEKRARETRNPAFLRSATVIGCALCEVVALIGLVLHIVTGSPTAWRYLVIAAAGMLLHFPRQQKL
jgi:F0F1-type ATP synthase membrane subunit c/vacuolar-type H+-ATPase subunit K